MSFLYNMTVKIRGSKMTYSNHRILRHLRRIIVLSRIHSEIRPSFRPYSSSRTGREPISMHLDADFVGSFDSERADNGYEICYGELGGI